jgi:hypothetical protein
LRIDRSLAALGAVLSELERQNVVPIGLSTHQATLDDVFLHLTGRALETEPPSGDFAASQTDTGANGDAGENGRRLDA